MIILEPYNNSDNSTANFKIYSDKNFFIQSNGINYTEAFIINEEDINNYIETNYSIPSPIASINFVYQTFLGDFHNISEQEIIEAKTVIEKAIQNLNDEDLYKLFNLLEKWKIGENYSIGKFVTYEEYIYKVITSHISNENPKDSIYYEKVNRPSNFVLEWDSNKKFYNKDDKVKVGTNLYKSLLDNNIWSPTIFPDAWELIQ